MMHFIAAWFYHRDATLFIHTITITGEMECFIPLFYHAILKYILHTHTQYGNIGLFLVLITRYVRGRLWI